MGDIRIIRRRRSVMISVAVEVPQKSSHSILQVGMLLLVASYVVVGFVVWINARIDMDWWVTFR